MAMLREGIRLGAVVALLLWAAQGAPWLQASLAAWATLMWSAGLWLHARVDRAATLVAWLVAVVVALGAAVALGVDILVLLVGSMALGVFVGRTRLLPQFGVEGDKPEEWARAHREQYRGEGTGLNPRAVGVTNDPYGGLLGSAPEVVPQRDPYEDALTMPVDKEGA